MANPIVTFEMENGDIMKAELYYQKCFPRWESSRRKAVSSAVCSVS